MLGRLKDKMTEATIPGISTATVSSAGQIRSLSLGNTSHQQDSAVTPQTTFGAASLSKPVFAYLVVKLFKVNEDIESHHQIGKFHLPGDLSSFDLDTPLYKVLPELLECADRFKARALTPRIVLAHMTGIPITHGDKPPEFDFAPGSEFSYGGLAYLYLQVAIIRLTNTSLNQLANIYVFSPFDMQHSSFIRSGMELSDEVESASQQLFPLNPDDFQAISANSLETTATDYGKFVYGLMTDPEFSCLFEDHISLLKDQWAHDMGISPDLLKKLSWGLGWALEKDQNGKVTKAFHYGDMNEWRAFVIIDLKNKEAFTYFANSTNGLALLSDLIPQRMSHHDILKFISEKFGFAINLKSGSLETQESSIKRIGEYLRFRAEQPINNRYLLTKAPRSKLFAPTLEAWLYEHRDDSPKLRREFDKRCGLLKV